MELPNNDLSKSEFLITKSEDLCKVVNSEFLENSQYFDKSNKKVIGEFNVKVSGIPINEFIQLTSKMYLYLKDITECGKTVKGIKKNVIKTDIKHENYKDILFNDKQIHHKMKTIRSQRHQLGSYEINKISLGCSNDKALYMTMEYTVTLTVITICNLVHFLDSFWVGMSRKIHEFQN